MPIIWLHFHFSKSYSLEEKVPFILKFEDTEKVYFKERNI